MRPNTRLLLSALTDAAGTGAAGEKIREFLLTMLFSMIPVVELRGGLPFGVAHGLPYPAAAAAAVIGNMIPVPFIIIYIRRIFAWLKPKHPRLGSLITRLETRAHTKGELVNKYRIIGLYILVAIPLPGTGAWTGALVAAMLDIRLKHAVPVIFAGVLTAALIMCAITFGVSTVL